MLTMATAAAGRCWRCLLVLLIAAVPSSAWCPTSTSMTITMAKKKSTPSSIGARGVAGVLARQNNAVLLVDVNNVRGATGFKCTTASFLEQLAQWAASTGDAKRTIAVVDHGATGGAFVYREMVVVFAGPNRTADDVIAHDTLWWSATMQAPAVVVTSDGELRQRCLRPFKRSRRGAGATDAAGAEPSQQPVNVFGSAQFAEALNSFNGASIGGDEGHSLRPLLAVESAMREAALVSDTRYFKKRRAKLVAQARRADRLGGSNAGAGAGTGVDAVVDAGVPRKPTTVLDFKFTERTWHRVLSAERLRRSLTPFPTDTAGHANSGTAEYARSCHGSGLDGGSPPARSLLSDHRLRRDSRQRTNLLRFVAAAVAPLRMVAEATGEAGSGSESGSGSDAPDTLLRLESEARADAEAIAAAEAEVRELERELGTAGTAQPTFPMALEGPLRRFIAAQGGSRGVDKLALAFAEAHPLPLEQVWSTRSIKEKVNEVAVKERRGPGALWPTFEWSGSASSINLVNHCGDRQPVSRRSNCSTKSLPDHLLRWHLRVDDMNGDEGGVEERDDGVDAWVAGFKGSRRRMRRHLKKRGHSGKSGSRASRGGDSTRSRQELYEAQREEEALGLAALEVWLALE